MSPAVEVYNCAVGSPDCSQCLGREDLGHLCVWSDGCRPRGTMQPLPGTCPAPEIRAVSTPPPLPPPLGPVTPTPECAHAQRPTWAPGPATHVFARTRAPMHCITH